MKLLILAAFLASTCTHSDPIAPSPSPSDVVPFPPSPVGASGGSGCEAACNRYAQLGCPEAKPTPKGASCVTVCENNEDGGISLHPDCVVHADSCVNARACQAIP